jgi:vesicle-fusing ATPase
MMNFFNRKEYKEEKKLSLSVPSSKANPTPLKQLASSPIVFKKATGKPLVLGDDGKSMVDGKLDPKIKALMYSNVAIFNANDPVLANLPPTTNHAKFNNGVIFQMCLLDTENIPFGSCFLNYLQRETINILKNNQGKKEEFVDSEINEFLVSLVHQQLPDIIFVKVQVDLFKTNGIDPVNKDVSETVLMNQWINLFKQTLHVGQKFPFNRSDWFPDLAAVLTIKEIKVSSAINKQKETKEEKKDEEDENLDDAQSGQLTQLTAIDWDPLPIVNWLPTEKTFTLNKNFNMKNTSIGGLNREFMTIFRRLIGTRLLPRSCIEKLGIKHPKGAVFHGPPGTGKTAIAREVHKMLGLKTPLKLVNGPEILNGLIGQAEQNLRNIFADAKDDWKKRGHKADIYLIVFDEIDSLFRIRSSGGGAGAQVGAQLVATFLTEVDGFDSPENIIVIGTTNRIDIIDPALLRPGRLEILLEIGLPDCRGREEILKVHTRRMSENKLLGQDVDLGFLAKATKNYSGAEIEGLVKAASSLAISEKIDTTDGTPKIIKSRYKPLADPIICMDHFLSAMNDICPAFGRSKELSLPTDLLKWSVEYEGMMNELRKYVASFKESKNRLMTILIEGEPACGQSSIAKNLALTSDFPLVKLISPETCGNSELEKVGSISTVFDDAYKSPYSIIIIDNIERLLEYTSVGPRFSNAVLQKLLVSLNRDPPNVTSRLLVLITTSNVKILQRLELEDSFKIRVQVPMVAENDYANLFQLLEFKMESNEVEKLKGKLPLIGIKNFLLMMDTVVSNKMTTADEFYARCKGLGFIKKNN